ncbi:MAG: RNAse H-fold protein YqgF [Planctomycetota bacterium]|nr:RNAse H-fold protein YqgF [Planctomycetota bacterium]
MGRILGLDFGTRRVGAALSDPSGWIASPLEVYERQATDRDAEHYRRLIEDEQIDRIVVGLPLHTSGREGESAILAREFGAWLGEVTGRTVSYHDERYTSHEADDAMRATGMKAKDRRARRDMLAAQIMLQAYLDAGSPTTETSAAPLDDPVDEGDS